MEIYPAAVVVLVATGLIVLTYYATERASRKHFDVVLERLRPASISQGGLANRLEKSVADLEDVRQEVANAIDSVREAVHPRQDASIASVQRYGRAIRIDRNVKELESSEGSVREYSTTISYTGDLTESDMRLLENLLPPQVSVRNQIPRSSDPDEFPPIGRSGTRVVRFPPRRAA